MTTETRSPQSLTHCLLLDGSPVHRSVMTPVHRHPSTPRLHTCPTHTHCWTTGQNGYQMTTSCLWGKRIQIRSHTRLLQPKKHDITTTNDIWSHQNKQARWPLQHVALLDNHRIRIILLKWSISTGEMYSMTCVEWAGDMVLVWCKLVHFWRRYTQKNYFYIICFQWPWPMTFRPWICSTSYSCPAIVYISTKLEVSVTFRFQENDGHGTDRHGWTDRQTDG